MDERAKIFRPYDVRGIYGHEVNEEIAYAIGAAFAQYLQREMKLELPFSIVMGMDMRGSSPFLARQLVRGLTDQGIDIVEIGLVPTPAFYYAVAFKNFAAGVMVTASHNPKEFNGFKFCGKHATPIGLGSGLEKIRDYALSSLQPRPVSSRARGKLSSLSGIVEEYVAQDLSYVNVSKIKKLKIAADPANAMGSLYLDELFKRISSSPIKMNWDLNGNMPIHEANPLKLETLQQLQAVIKNEKADFGIATDGDGDRIVFLDEKGDVIDASVIVGLVAQVLLKKHPGARIGLDLRLSRSASEMVRSAGGEAVEVPVGHSFIKKIMKEKDILFSGELSSHFYFRENFNFESPVFITATLLHLRSEIGRPLSEIWRSQLKHFHSGEVNFDVVDKEAMIAKIASKYTDGNVSKLDGLKVSYPTWWFSVRPANTENLLRLNLEADSESEMKEKVEEIKKMIA